MTNKYPRIEELGLDLHELRLGGCLYVRADHLERILEKAMPVNSYGSMYTWERFASDNSAYTGLVINIKPLTKPDPKEEKLKELESKLQGLLKEIEGMRK